MADKGKMALRQAKLSHDRLREVLSYDPATGIFLWLVSTSNRMKVGAQAGQLCKGARVISIDGTKFMAHRLAWFYVRGVWPEGDIDHEDLSPDHNWMDNLREAFGSQNHYNCKMRKHNRAGIKGAHWHSQSGRWLSQITVDKKRIYLGLFDRPEDAGLAYAKASVEYHGEFGRMM